jgi:hypothetical protein
LFQWLNALLRNFSGLGFYLKTSFQGAAKQPRRTLASRSLGSRSRATEANRATAPFCFVSFPTSTRPETAKTKRFRFATRNEGLRSAGRKPLKSLSAANHNFAGSFVFNGLCAISFRSFLAWGSLGRKALSSPLISSSPEILTGILNFGKPLLAFLR